MIRVKSNSRALKFSADSRRLSVGASVDELERCWLDVKRATARSDPSGARAVSYIDDNGRRLLECMFNEGAGLRRSGS